MVIVQKCLDPSGEHGEEDPLMESKVAIPIWMYHEFHDAQMMLQEAIEGIDEFSMICHQIIEKEVEYGLDTTAKTTENDRFINGFMVDVELDVIKTTVQEEICVGGKSGKQT